MHRRLYIFTGKGGVGKTTLAMSFTKQLQREGRQVLYYCFYQLPEKQLWDALKLPVLELELEKSAEIYIAKKLNSKTIASWIMLTHFFKSLFQILPALGHMILLGHIIDELEKNPELIIVLDSPASGHALTMFESSTNFKNIFKTGLIVKDIERMQNFLNTEANIATYIIANPTDLAMTEARELQKELNENCKENTKACSIIINNSYQKFFDLYHLETNDLPDFIQSKLNAEQEMHLSSITFPHLTTNIPEELVRQLMPFTQELV
jgi:arsenite-transporting ATPase